MCCRKIEMNDTRQQRFDYPEGSLPVPRICNALNDFSNGTVECHWHGISVWAGAKRGTGISSVPQPDF